MMMVFGGQKSAKFVICSQNHTTMMGQKSQKNQHFGSISQKNSKIQYYEALKNQNGTQNPPTCENYPTMMAKNLRFSKNIQNQPIKEVKKVQNL